MSGNKTTKSFRPTSPGVARTFFRFTLFNIITLTLRFRLRYVNVLVAGVTFSFTLRSRSGREAHRGSRFKDPGRHFPVPYKINKEKKERKEKKRDPRATRSWRKFCCFALLQNDRSGTIRASSKNVRHGWKEPLPSWGEAREDATHRFAFECLTSASQPLRALPAFGY